MAQKVWEVIDESTGNIKITITADSTTQGVTISNSPDWQTVTDMNHITTILHNAQVWLEANLGAA